MLKKMEKSVMDLAPMVDRIDWGNEAVYATWLSQAYYIAKRSTSYLGLCLFHAEPYPEFQKRCTQHIAEETGHEVLILNDLKNLKQNLGEELPETSAIYQPQYFRIVGENPLSFLGYVFFLELLAPSYGPEIIQKISNKKTCTFLQIHTHADDDHIIEAEKILNTLSENIRQQIFSNFQMTERSYAMLLKALAELSYIQKAA